MCSEVAGRRSRGGGGPHSPGPLPPAGPGRFLRSPGETPISCFGDVVEASGFLIGREGKSWAIRAGGATGQVSWATTLWGRQKDWSLLQFWLQGVARRIKHRVNTL